MGDDAFFPRTLFVPWAAFSQIKTGEEVLVNTGYGTKKVAKMIKETWDQNRVFNELSVMSTENKRAMSLEDEMVKLTGLPPIDL